jgi:hypothetical protein
MLKHVISVKINSKKKLNLKYRIIIFSVKLSTTEVTRVVPLKNKIQYYQLKQSFLITLYREISAGFITRHHRKGRPADRAFKTNFKLYRVLGNGLPRMSG